jgi:hypothetical protein
VLIANKKQEKKANGVISLVRTITGDDKCPTPVIKKKNSVS